MANSSTKLPNQPKSKFNEVAAQQPLAEGPPKVGSGEQTNISKSNNLPIATPEALTAKSEIKPSESLKQNAQAVAGSESKIGSIEEEKEQKVFYASFDFDHCLAWNIQLPKGWGAASEEAKVEYIKREENGLIDDIERGNITLLRLIAQEVVNGGYTKVCINIGTNRQDPYRDYVNAVDLASPGCGKVYERLHNKLHELIEEENAKKENAKTIVNELDTRLMLDTTHTNRSTNELKNTGSNEGAVSGAGEELSQALWKRSQQDIAANAQSEPKALFDRNKITLIYQQIQRAKALNPNAKQIDFHFFDDNTLNILGPLYGLFSANPDLVPKGVVLHFHNYASGQIKWNYTSIIGSGDPDFQYKKTSILVSAFAIWGDNPKIVEIIDPMLKKPEAYEEKQIVAALVQVKPLVNEKAYIGKSVGLQGSGASYTLKPDYFRMATDLTKKIKTPQRKPTIKSIKISKGGLFGQKGKVASPAGSTEALQVSAAAKV